MSIRGRSRQFVLFLLAGGIAAAANFGSRFAFSLWFGFPAAVALAYGIGMMTAFVLMRHYVFDARHGHMGAQVLKFSVVNAFALLQTMAVSLLLARNVLPWLGVRTQAEALAHAVGVAFPVFTSYLLHKRATFR